MLIEKAMKGRGDNAATDKIKQLADLEKIEFDVQQDLLDTLQDMYRNEKREGQSFSDWLKSVPVSRLRAIKLKNGGSVNEKYEDLLDAYFKKHISGFAIDVYQNEPVEKNFLNKINPDMNCILTPHIAGITEESNERVSKFIADKIIDFFK